MRLRSAAGYTLTELIITAAIVGIISSVGAVLLIQTNTFFLANRARGEIDRDARNALDTMDRFLRQGVASSITIDTPSGQGYYSRITFQIVNGPTMRFYQSGSKLIQERISGATTVRSTLTGNLYYLGFSFPDTQNPSIINVSITTSKTIALGRRNVLQMSIQKVRIMN